LLQEPSLSLWYLVSLHTALWYRDSIITLSIPATTQEAVTFFQLQQVINIEEHEEPSGSKPPKKKVHQRARDEQGRFVKAPTKEQFSIDKAARQLATNSAQRDLAESATELEKPATVTTRGFPESPQKGLPSKAPVAAPARDPDSSSTDSDDMSDHGEGAGGPGPEPVPEPLPRLSIKVPSPKRFTGDGEELKPEAFDRWYNSVQLYLRLHNISQNAVGSGNYWILYIEGRAQEAAFQAAELFGENLTRDILVTYLRE